MQSRKRRALTAARSSFSRRNYSITAISFLFRVSPVSSTYMISDFNLIVSFSKRLRSSHFISGTFLGNLRGKKMVFLCARELVSQLQPDAHSGAVPQHTHTHTHFLDSTPPLRLTFVPIFSVLSSTNLSPISSKVVHGASEEARVVVTGQKKQTMN